MKQILTILFCCLAVFSITSQELNCNVLINSDQVQGTNRSVFNTLQQSLSNFVNNRRWTTLNYANAERIDCNMNIIIKKVEDNVFSGEIMIQSRRPVYNSSYTSTLLNFRDNNLTFDYRENDQLEMNENTISSNLTAIMMFYVYIIIGYDMDSYSRLGGTPFFEQAEQIVNLAQSAEFSGWKAFESTRNRYALINNLMDEAFKKYRNYFYEYHRLGLDEMTDNVANGRARIAAGLPLLRDANRARPSAIVISSFLDAKSDELINIFSQGTDKEKKDAVEILSDVNPTASDRYRSIQKPK
ncbi:MAG: DUF4835 family protein [Paludibacter sp.]|jgi:hypothetical protein|nr:DUF4835 family protein [Paludibacter sp.]